MVLKIPDPAKMSGSRSPPHHISQIYLELGWPAKIQSEYFAKFVKISRNRAKFQFVGNVKFREIEILQH